jgi:dihydrofolate reductase
MILNTIVAMTSDRVIGLNGAIPWRYAVDFAWFKHKTMGDTLVMGRKTFESIGKPLKDRRTVVISKSKYAGVTTYPSIEKFLIGEEYTPTVWICGGEQIYKELVHLSELIYITRVPDSVQGDTHFPKISSNFILINNIPLYDDKSKTHLSVGIWADKKYLSIIKACNERFLH